MTAAEDDTAARVRTGSAGAAVVSYLQTQAARLRDTGSSVGAEHPDAVHRMRVTTRRLRSVLAAYRRLFDRTGTEPVLAELRWLAGSLGAARDAEVMRVRLREALDGMPGVAADVRRLVDRELRRRHDVALRAVVRTLDTKRYARLLADLEALVADPPLRGRAAKPAERVLPRLVSRAWHRVESAHDRTSFDHDLRLHEVRKAAKRARYAADVASPVIGTPATRFGKAHKRIQSVLGDHHDTVVCRELICSLTEVAQRRGLSTFDLGRLYAAQERDGVQAEEEFTDRGWPRASAGKLRRWLG